MKKLLTLLLCGCMLLSGCGPNIEKMIEEEQYEEAYELILEDPQKFGQYSDEVRYQLALIAYENNDLDQAIQYLENNDHSEAMFLLDDYRNEKLISQCKEYFEKFDEKSFKTILKEIKQVNDAKDKEESKEIMAKYFGSSDTYEGNMTTDLEAFNELFPYFKYDEKAMHYYSDSFLYFIRYNASLDIEIEDEVDAVVEITDFNTLVDKNSFSAQTYAALFALVEHQGGKITFEKDRIVMEFSILLEEFQAFQNNDSGYSFSFQSFSTKLEFFGKNTAYVDFKFKNERNVDYETVYMRTYFISSDGELLGEGFAAAEDVKANDEFVAIGMMSEFDMDKIKIIDNALDGGYKQFVFVKEKE